MPIKHTPVLLEEAVQGLNLSANANVIDGTLGAGGHARAILKAIAPKGRLMAFDRDCNAILQAEVELKEFYPRVILINDSFSKLDKYVDRDNFDNVAGVLLDLGFSSTQLTDRNRGFSFQTSGLLDLRYNQQEGLSAADLLNTASFETLEKIFRDGEEVSWRRLTKAIVEARRRQPFKNTEDLLKVVESVKGHRHRSLHPATLVWQALRLKVNDELSELAIGLVAARNVLVHEGRLVVISFHSGEDRIVKNFFRQESRDCLCPPALPTCVCNHVRSLKIVTKKVVKPSASELLVNSRARSAKLRIAAKIIS